MTVFVTYENSQYFLIFFSAENNSMYFGTEKTTAFEYNIL